MPKRKNVLLLFSKVPEPGLVKTRLTTLKDGQFSPETASYLYHCMLFDVVEICCAALDSLERADDGDGPQGSRDAYELVISTTPASNVAVMERLFADSGDWPRDIRVIADEGSSFDEHYNDAFEQAWDMGADAVLSMGVDMPALTVGDVVNGFRKLHELDDAERYPRGGIVLAPDQEMGVSIVGWTKDAAYADDTRLSHDGVFYNQDGLTVLPAYIQKARDNGLPALYLPPVPDVDTMADLIHNITLVEALNYCSPFDGNTPPWRTWDALCRMGIQNVRVAPNDLRDPRSHIDGQG